MGPSQGRAFNGRPCKASLDRGLDARAAPWPPRTIAATHRSGPELGVLLLRLRKDAARLDAAGGRRKTVGKQPWLDSWEHS